MDRKELEREITLLEAWNMDILKTKEEGEKCLVRISEVLKNDGPNSSLLMHLVALNLVRLHSLEPSQDQYLRNVPKAFQLGITSLCELLHRYAKGNIAE